MKLPNLPEAPKTATDKVVFLFALTATSFWAAIIIMGLQGRKPPPDFKEIGMFLSGGVIGIVTGKHLS